MAKPVNVKITTFCPQCLTASLEVTVIDSGRTPGTPDNPPGGWVKGDGVCLECKYEGFYSDTWPQNKT